VMGAAAPVASGAGVLSDGGHGSPGGLYRQY
jgi:hypothetical protein